MAGVVGRSRRHGSRAILASAAAGVAAALVLGVAGVGGAQEEEAAGFKTGIKPYLEGLAGWETEPLLSVGDRVPETGVPNSEYQMVGIPDGLGATQDDASRRSDDDEDGVTRLYMNHELAQPVVSHPRVSTPVYQRGAFVSEYRMAEDGSILSGRRAFDTVFQDDTLVGPAADSTNTTRAFSRFCSGYMADRRVGFDRPIYLTGEETRRDTPESPTASFSPNGSQSVAIFENDSGKLEAHALSDFGYFAKENTVVAPNTGRKTVAFATEDGPQTPDSQLYMYVGEKQRTGTVLERNGLVGGKLYVFVSNDSARNSEATFDNGSLPGRWVEIPKEERENEIEQEAAADAAGAFGFVRIEDGAFGRQNEEFRFVTTGDSQPSTINRLGVNYKLQFKPNKAPEKQTPVLSVIYNADQVDAAGEDIAFSPDNMDVVGRQQIVQEDGTASSRPEMGARGRDGSVWLVDGTGISEAPGDFPDRERVAELVGSTEGGRDGILTGPGVWESSGVISVSRFFGGGTYLLDVQAHPPTTAPGGVQETVEDGQLLFLRPAGEGDDE